MSQLMNQQSEQPPQQQKKRWWAKKVVRIPLMCLMCQASFRSVSPILPHLMQYPICSQAQPLFSPGNR
jgi:hypothetical protein